MRFARRLLIALSFTFLLAVVAPRYSAPHAHAQQTATPTGPAQITPPQPAPQPGQPQAYTLPPDKLAKATAISSALRRSS